MAVTIRQFEWGRDLWPAVDLVYKVWFADSKSTLVGRLSACNFLVHYLRQGTTLKVACEGDTMLGIMSYDNKRDAKVLSRPWWVKAQAACLEYGCKALMYFLPNSAVPRLFNEKFFVNYQRMRALVSNPADPELLLLLVGESAQGKGVGRQMMADAEDDLRAQGFSSYYLLTDSSCNWFFYERMGMTKALDVAMNFGIPHVAGYEHYLNMYLRALIYTRML